MRADPQLIVRFWLEDVGFSGWWGGNPALDAEISARFGLFVRAAHGGAYRRWEADPTGALAVLILLDQFTRNIYRNDPNAFACDPLARIVARRAIGRGHDLATTEPARAFFYLPFEHSERLADQDRSVRLFAARCRSRETLIHARAHRSVIRRFGRFPFRNENLGRESTFEERRWLDAGAYMAEVELHR